MTTIVFAGGGTGGHIFPGLAIVDELRKAPDIAVAWIGSSRGMDRSLVEAHGVPFYGIPSGKLRRYFSLENLIDLFRIVGGFFFAVAALLKLKPAVLFSKGGFVSVPPCVAARLLGIPVITHECDVTPGLATRINARFAASVFVSFEETGRYLRSRHEGKILVTGNPVRPGFYSASAERGRGFLGVGPDSLPILFVQGGSLGARQINALVAESIDLLCERCIVVHQTGAKNVDQVTYPKRDGLRERYKPYPFIGSEMPDVLAAADLVLSRSGANTLWECAVTGTPMVLIPLSGSGTRGDQVDNARYFVERGAAVMLTGSEASRESLIGVLDRLLAPGGTLGEMASNAAALAGANPAKAIASALLTAAGMGSQGEANDHRSL